jgi:hypothetical protein
LNFGNQYDFWQQVNDSYIGFTENDLFTNFWGNRIQQLYASDVKILTGTFKLTPNEINALQFNDRVYFLNAWWRLLSMNDADITNNSLVQCQFIKLPYFIETPSELIAPTYQQAPFTPQPEPTGSTYQHIVFSSNITGTMCDETANQIPLFSNCSILSAGCSVFSDTTATTPIIEGTLIKVAGDNTIYQVIEYGILTNFTTC